MSEDSRGLQIHYKLRKFCPKSPKTSLKDEKTHKDEEKEKNALKEGIARKIVLKSTILMHHTRHTCASGR